MSNVNTVPPNVPEFGELIAKCGPKQGGRGHYLVYGIGCLVFSIACFIAPATFLPPKPGDEQMLWGIAIAAGAFMALIGLFMIVAPTLEKPQIIFMYETGFVNRVGTRDQKVAFSDVQQVRFFEWYEHRFADQEFNVRITLKNKREILFSSSLVGNSDAVMQQLRNNVENTLDIPFS